MRKSVILWFVFDIIDNAMNIGNDSSAEVMRSRAVVTNMSNTSNLSELEFPVIDHIKNVQHDFARSITPAEQKVQRSHKRMLVVGGSDGSGTRRVVWLLAVLGVRMVAEDSHTYDIHANSIGGWPSIVTPVIEVR